MTMPTIDVEYLRKSGALRALDKIDLIDLSHKELEDMYQFYKETRQPFYKLWYYVRKDWETGYSERQIKWLRQAFNRIRNNEGKCITRLSRLRPQQKELSL